MLSHYGLNRIVRPTLISLLLWSTVSSAQSNPPSAKEALLAQLHDIQTPNSISLWPLGPGWWVLIILIAVLITIGIYLGFKKYSTGRYRKTALKELEHLLAEQNSMAHSNYAAAVFALLKRTALIPYSRHAQHISSLSGENWLNFLLTSCSKLNRDELDKNYILSVYAPDVSFDQVKLNQLAKKWILNHRTAQQLQAYWQSENTKNKINDPYFRQNNRRSKACLNSPGLGFLC